MPFVLERSDGHRIAVVPERLARTGLAYEVLTAAFHRLPDSVFVDGKPLRGSIDMEKVVGRAAIIKAPEIKPNQFALFARRRLTAHNRPSRVVKIDGVLPQTRYVTIIGEWVPQDELWMVRTAYSGQYVYPQPWDFAAIAKQGLALDRVLAFWCRAAFLYNPKEFETRDHQDTWARLIDDASHRLGPDLAERVGYASVRQLWH